ncbi:uncharacterized mitochondrial protein AtMg00810-like [Lycium ferocissimum]|uniref:uncharacterized mitochondrial protein AtMg00810-like n=1 Tax=Lycium ferocissimum TaxID=112874 RepID=UPI002815A629|nr:uncharacterized mitochondrial protein AtMg00810-like [Lycium ferocissimum]
MNIVGLRWVFKTKLKADGSIERFKAWLVAKGYNQIEGVDFDDTFSPVVKATTIRLVLAVATTLHWSIKQLDVKNAFLHGDLIETVFIEQPPGFVDPNYPVHVCRLKKALYGLKQAPKAWFHKFSTHLLHLGFICSKSDSSLFVWKSSKDTILLLLYVDDIVLTGGSPFLLHALILNLKSKFAMKDMGDLHYFLGIEVTRCKDGLFLCQRKYALDVLERTKMACARAIHTPFAQKHELYEPQGYPIDPSGFRSIVSALQYLTLTRPDLSHAVNLLCQFVQHPVATHWAGVKRVLQYLAGSTKLGLHITLCSSLNVVGFSDADWGGCPLTRRSTTGLCVFLGSNYVSWASKKQTTMARSSAEAEYRALASLAAEITWLTYILRDIGVSLPNLGQYFSSSPH